MSLSFFCARRTHFFFKAKRQDEIPNCFVLNAQLRSVFCTSGSFCKNLQWQWRTRHCGTNCSTARVTWKSHSPSLHGVPNVIVVLNRLRHLLCAYSARVILFSGVWVTSQQPTSECLLLLNVEITQSKTFSKQILSGENNLNSVLILYFFWRANCCMLTSSTTFSQKNR